MIPLREGELVQDTTPPCRGCRIGNGFATRLSGPLHPVVLYQPYGVATADAGTQHACRAYARRKRRLRLVWAVLMRLARLFACV
jgi:hypothetical protein